MAHEYVDASELCGETSPGFTQTTFFFANFERECCLYCIAAGFIFSSFRPNFTVKGISNLGLSRALLKRADSAANLFSAALCWLFHLQLSCARQSLPFKRPAAFLHCRYTRREINCGVYGHTLLRICCKNSLCSRILCTYRYLFNYKSDIKQLILKQSGISVK